MVVAEAQNAVRAPARVVGDLAVEVDGGLVARARQQRLGGGQGVARLQRRIEAETEVQPRQPCGSDLRHLRQGASQPSIEQLAAGQRRVVGGHGGLEGGGRGRTQQAHEVGVRAPSMIRKTRRGEATKHHGAASAPG
jgi:hypothetical protein